MKTILSIPKSLIDFFKSVFQELKLVEWISRKQTINLTTSVILACIILGTFLVILDRIFTTIVAKILL